MAKANRFLKGARTMLKTALLFVSTGTVALFMAACYGVPVMMRRFGLVVLDRQGKPVPGLRVKNDSKGISAYTDGDGSVDIPAMTEMGNEVTVTVEDIDGGENGGPYAPKTLTLKIDETVRETLTQ